MKWSIKKSILTLLITTLGFLGTSSYLFIQNNHNKELAAKSETELKSQKEKNTSTEDDLETITKRYQDLYKEKNGTANEKLTSACKTLFTAIYKYDSTSSEGTVEKRKKSVQNIADEEVVNTLFPQDAEDTVPSVDISSQLSENPKVYMQVSDSNQLEALVLVKYKVSIADSDDSSGTYLYKINYDQFRDKFSSLENLGEMN